MNDPFQSHYCRLRTDFKLMKSQSAITCSNLNNRNTRTRCEISSELILKTPERRHWRRSVVFIVNFEHIPHLVLVFLLLTWVGKCRMGWLLFIFSALYRENGTSDTAAMTLSKAAKWVGWLFLAWSFNIF